MRDAAPPRAQAPAGFADAFAEHLRRSPIAEQVEKANEQHYEVPAEFFRLVLGPRLKYSACLWPEGTETLGAGRGGDARPDVRAGRRRGRDDAARPRLRLGILDRLAGGALSEVADRRGLELAAAARVDRVAAAAERPGQDRRREHARAGGEVRPDPVGRDARAHAQLRGALRADRGLARAGRPLLLSRLLARSLRVSLRGRLDGAALLHRGDDALGRPATALRPRPRPRAALARLRAPLRPHRRGLARAAGREPRRGGARRRPPLGRELARLLPRLRRALGLRRRTEWLVSHYRFAKQAAGA